MSSGTVVRIQGQPLEVTVVSCTKLKDTEWISRQDPYVCLEYASTKFRTRTSTGGGKHPVFQEKFVVPLIEGLRELTVVVWNSNTVTFDNFIGTGKVQLNQVLSQGFDDSSWPLQTKSGRASKSEVISSGINGTRNGALQLMQAKLQVFSLLVLVKEVNFLRFCKQHAKGYRQWLMC
ncbi:homeobox-leucine zipper protein HDG7-like [Vicia villosa]|uniref:homeobox-leucine zipper protein HDG7-like n=1 Tax=Vicia villosa TaxID=3911 RepID=UPI00273C924C|nr:homeobox-leucine zipper protein HDG7-like [Vicia villosa]